MLIRDSSKNKRKWLEWMNRMIVERRNLNNNDVDISLKILKCYCTIRDIDAMIPNAISMILPTSLFSTKCRRCLIVSKFSTKITSIIACPNWILMLQDLYLNVVLTTQRVACIAVARGVSTNCPTVVTFCGGFECYITRSN